MRTGHLTARPKAIGRKLHPTSFTKGLNIGKPDRVFSPAKRFEVPASGRIEYTYSDHGTFVPAGSGLVFQLHYTANGESASDLPHMHVRGKSMLLKTNYPNGTSEILLNVPRYDFNWQ